MFDRGLRERVAVVTGGARGIGEACVRALAEEGARVAILDLDTPESHEVVELVRAIHANGGTSLYVRADVTQRLEVENAMSRVQSELGEIDILVNNAGKGRPPAPLEQIADADWNAVLALNLTGPMLCTRAVVQAMKRRQCGRIVNISSIAARGRGESPNVSYVSAKAGVLGLTRQLAVELGPYGITVNAVAPGGILSGRVAPRWAEKTDEQKQRTTDAIPLRRLGFPKEVARAVVFLASNDASYITGVTLDVNGGRYF